MNKRFDFSVLPDLFYCDFETGVLYRKERPLRLFKNSRLHKSWNSRFANKECARKNGFGYLRVHINGVDIMAHRLVWLLKNGSWPDFEIDHINHNRSDNRPCNLRKSSYAENNKNKSIYKNNTSGITGVVWHKRQKRWIATIFCNGKRTHIGSFKSKIDAVKARINFERYMGFHENHGKELGMEVIEL